jgi:hypothetical protein
MRKHRLCLCGLLLLAVALSLSPPALAHHGHGKRTFTLVSGNAAAPGRDPFTKFSVDQGATWDHAFVVPKCGTGPLDFASCASWADPIPGTEWITVSADKSGPPSSLYKRWFKLPRKCTCKGASLVIDVHAVTISLNGVVFGAQPAGDLFANFQDPPERFTTTGPFRRWKNVLGFSVRDCGNPTGLDYSATVTCKRKHHHWGWGH